ncbi:UDP-N-acetylmuramate dehydrogenase [Gulbenkiania mobilis]|uniref:UDP-N-acetylmuramate dehydrogenase n=1 Tax=Gulbenkiania mobilis TaxID=397457 RepID=UPI000AACB934|nr:UDP-N-acetylmuramate dehydrogenase [Gulbenkiania mobilis]
MKGQAVALEIRQDVDLTPYNTFGMRVRAAYFTELCAKDDLPALLASEPFRRGPVLWLGGGSNLLFTQDYPGLVIRMALQGVRILEDDGETVCVEAAAGENWHGFVSHTLSQGWAGLENLSLIPGTVGASPIQNIGAYGVEVQDCIESVLCMDTASGRETVLSRADCHFGYRDSVFKHEGRDRLVVLAVRFRLARHAPLRIGYGDIRAALAEAGVEAQPSAADVSRAVIRIRQSKLPDPAVLGNAGSFFKNPVVSSEQAEALLVRHPDLPHYPAGPGRIKLAAGWLIDRAGLKGYREGDAGVHDRQALVLVNHGQASGKEMWQLAQKVQATVETRYGVRLEPEPIVL